MELVHACFDAAAWLLRPATLLLARPAEQCVVAAVTLCNALYLAAEYVFFGLYSLGYLLIYVTAYSISQLRIILYDMCDIYISKVDSNLYFGTMLGFLTGLLPSLAAVFTLEKRTEELKRCWGHFETERRRLELERKEMEQKRKDMELEQEELENKRKELEDERRELELDIQEREREYVETREMNLREWWSERQDLEEEEAARNARMAEREREESEYQDLERSRRELERYEYLERIKVERAKWDRLDVEEKMKWCQMRMPWVKTTAEFKKDAQGMGLETPD